MKHQPNRLPSAKPHPFHGQSIDRKRPIRFRLNGQVIDGFAGDTVLSAALASGFEVIGTHNGQPIGLGERLAPAVLPAAHHRDMERALPMARMPASEGLDLVTWGRSERGSFLQSITSWRGGPHRSLHVPLSQDGVARPWQDLAAERRILADIVVIGAGIAGLAAAKKAAELGERVIVVEQRGYVGGDARYFGTLGEEETPDQAIERLIAALGRRSNVSIMTHTEAFAWVDGGIRVHQVLAEQDHASGHVIDIAAPRVVLATGSVERLPVFAGNRLPGVNASMAAYHRAYQYGVWQGISAIFNTGIGAAYRLAMQASDAGVKVARVTDTRLDPQSRFIEFSKAYGITLAPGLQVEAVKPAKAGLSIRFGLSFDAPDREMMPLIADQLLVCGGFQPNLAFWHMAGGESRFIGTNARMNAYGAIEGVELAGAAAGYQTNSACLASGTAAACKLLGKSADPFDDPVIDPIYESPDAPASFAGHSHEPAYLSNGGSLLMRPARPPARRSFWPGTKRAGDPLWLLAEDGQRLQVDEIAAGVQSDAIPEAMAGIIARERSVRNFDLADAGRAWSAPQSLEEDIPAYLEGRFGERAERWTLIAEDNRAFEPGCLVYVNSDSTDPRQAIGVVTGKAPDDGATIALIGKKPLAPGERLVVRDISSTISVRLVAPLEAG